MWQGDRVDSVALPVRDDAAPPGPAGATASGGAVRDRRGPERVDVPRSPLELWQRALLCLAVLGCGGYVLWRIWDAYRFYQDDMLQFGVAQESGLSWKLISLNVFQHFGPVNRLAHLFLVRVTDFSLGAGALLASALVVAFLASLLWVLHEIGASFRARLLSVLVAGLSITVLDTAVWADASLHIFPALVATNAVVAAHVRALTTGRRRWHVAAVVLLAAGALTQERVLFALPLVVLVDWLVLGAGRSFADRLRILRGAAVPLAGMTVVALGAGAYIYTNYAAGSSSRPSLATTARTSLGAFAEGIWPPWVGVRLDSLGSLPVQFGIVAGFLLVAAALVWICRRNGNGLAFIVAAFVLYYGFLAFSPILTDDLVAATALRLHNGSYLLMPTLLGVCTLRFRRRAAEPVAPSPGWGRRSWTTLGAAAAVAVFLVLMGGRFTATTWQDERAAHEYLSAVGRSEPVWSRPGVTVVPLMAPITVGRDWAAYYARHEFFLRYYHPGFVPQELGDNPIVLDASGRPRPVQLITEASMRPATASTCRGPARSMLVSDVPVRGEPLFLQLTYRTDRPMDVRVTSTQGLTPDAEPFGNWAVPLTPGEHTVVIPLHSNKLASVLLDWSVTDSDHCVTAASIVRPVYSAGGECRAMDSYGVALGTVACPGRRAG